MAGNYRHDFSVEAGNNPVGDDMSVHSSIPTSGHKFRPSLADDIKVGFFSLDRATQTTESEIVKVKDVSEVLQELLKDSADMKRDINFSYHVMEADFQAKLERKAIELYCRSNERITEIEKTHLERTATVRRAFKQQLSDAIARMNAYYAKDMAARMGKKAAEKDREMEMWKLKAQELAAANKRNEATILMLQSQIEQYKREIAETERATRAAVVMAEKVEVEEMDGKSQLSRSESVVAEIEGLRDEVHFLEQKCARLEDTVQEQDMSNEELNALNGGLREQLEHERTLVQQLRDEKAELLKESKNDNEFDARMLENLRLQLEREMQRKLEEALRKQQAERLDDAAKINLLLSKNAGLEAEIAELKKKLFEAMKLQVKPKTDDQNRNLIELGKAQRSEARLLVEVTRLRSEIEIIHKTWEKKFGVLQLSLYSLKDESYLRQTLQRESSLLHKASIAYDSEKPVGIASPQFLHPVESKRSLPDIKSNKVRNPPDLFSLTASAGSDRHPSLYTFEDELEKEVTEGEEELPPGYVPLPCPHERTKPDSTDNRPSTCHSHVVVLPSTEVC